MALIFCDGFDHYVSADILKKWTSIANAVAGDGTFAVSPDYARPPGGMGLRAGTGTNRQIRKTLSGNYAVLIAGFAVYFETTVNGGGNAFFVFEDTAAEQCSLRLSGSGQLIFSRSGTTLATSTNTFSANTWYHVEVKVTINNTTGTYEVRVNGSATGWIAAATGANTRGTGSNNYANGIMLTPPQSATRYDDLYVLSSTSPNNDFVGAQKIITLLPNGVGNYAQWTGNYAANFANVNELAADGDSTFNQSSTANQIDSFPFDDAPAGTVTAVQHVLEMRQDAGAQRQVAPLQRSGSTDYVGTTFNTAGSHVFVMDPRDTDPATSAAWTVSNINAAEFGYKLVS